MEMSASNILWFGSGCILIDPCSEVVLSVLLSTFRFEETNKPVVWNVGAVWYPTVGSESNTPELPLKVSLLKARKT